MSIVEDKLREIGMQLPPAPPPQAVYIPFRRIGNLVFTAGTGPLRDDAFVYKGKVGSDLTVEEGYKAARIAMLNLLSIIKDSVGDLDRVNQIVKVTGFVASAPGFDKQPEVMNGASELLEILYGERGRHARSAIGVNELPQNIPVEIEMIAEVRD